MQSGDGGALFEAVQSAVDDLAEGADFVILRVYLGNNAVSRPHTYAYAIGHNAGIDAVLDGFSHDSDKAVTKNRDGVGWLRISAPDGSVDTPYGQVRIIAVAEPAQ